MYLHTAFAQPYVVLAADLAALDRLFAATAANMSYHISPPCVWRPFRRCRERPLHLRVAAKKGQTIFAWTDWACQVAAEPVQVGDYFPDALLSRGAAYTLRKNICAFLLCTSRNACER